MEVMRQLKRDETVTAHYSCTRCKLSGIDIQVPKKTEEQGHMDWAVKVIFSIAMKDHLAKSPDCKEQFLEIGVRPADYKPPEIILQ